ncbi:Transcription factor, MADS-box [Artemisia annua]|uniref:Transcription factor, MADS-box n=1 Tax=Artemisia annua TaxID=35608 RepID=A0A2U1N1Z1_ARTAN|nr:Transcription factor, MADS-box [Artemisia annua]
MGRRKLEMKRIEDKNSRQVTFSKRRTGLMKKARQLSVLCDVDIAVLVFSARGKLYESCSGTTANRYERSCAEAGERTNNGAGGQLEVLSQCTKFRTCRELLQMVDRLVEENNSEELSVTDMTELELELDAALVQTRLRKLYQIIGYSGTQMACEMGVMSEGVFCESFALSVSGSYLYYWPGHPILCMNITQDLEMIVQLKSALSAVFDATMKLIQDFGRWQHAPRLSSSEDVDIGILGTSVSTQLMMEYASTLQEEEKKLREDKEELEKQVASAKQLQKDGGCGGLNDLATNQTNSPQHLVTLPLFNG